MKLIWTLLAILFAFLTGLAVYIDSSQAVCAQGGLVTGFFITMASTQ